MKSNTGNLPTKLVTLARFVLPAYMFIYWSVSTCWMSVVNVLVAIRFSFSWMSGYSPRLIKLIGEIILQAVGPGFGSYYGSWSMVKASLTE